MGELKMEDKKENCSACERGTYKHTFDGKKLTPVRYCSYHRALVKNEETMDGCPSFKKKKENKSRSLK
jgi:hypothetical protein